MQSGQLSPGKAHMLALASLRVSSACRQTSNPHSCRREAWCLAGRRVSVLLTIQDIDFLRRPQV